MSIGARIKEIRKSSGLTQQKFAEKIGLKRNTIGNYEIDLIYPSDRTIVDICRTFNISETWLRTGEGEMFRQDGDSVVDRLCAELHADELEAEIIRAYFRIDERIRLPFLRRLIQEVQERPAVPNTAGQERTELDLAAKVAELERQNQEKDKQLRELADKVAAMEEEDALLGLTDGFSTSPSESVGKFNSAKKV